MSLNLRSNFSVHGDDRIAVCGWGRCGTSLTMQMLEAGGVRVPSTYPFFEDWPPVGDTFWTEPGLKAVKILAGAMAAEPDIFSQLKTANFRWVWLARKPIEQARSMIKFTLLDEGHFPIAMGPDKALLPESEIVERIRFASHRARQMLPPNRGMVLEFERLIRDPLDAATLLCRHLKISSERVPAMVEVVRPRSVSCLPSILERELFESRFPPSS